MYVSLKVSHVTYTSLKCLANVGLSVRLSSVKRFGVYSRSLIMLSSARALARQATNAQVRRQFSAAAVRCALKSMEGQNVPSVTWPARDDDTWIKINSDDIFKGRTVAVFSLPGAFTPTCSSTHLPRYNELAPTFRKHGVDEIICISVNDTFVMNEWARDQEADNITLIPDGNGTFTEKMGMLVDKSAIGFGKRSWRYSMLVKDAVIEKMWIEPEKEGDPFEVSDADTLLKYVAPGITPPPSVAIITKDGCPHCERAKELLEDNDIMYEEIVLGYNVTTRGLRGFSGKGSVPQVYIGGNHIGGADDLEKYFKSQ